MALIAYGPDPEQVGDLVLPDGPGPHPVVALWHGGGFAPEYGRDMLAPAAADLAAQGWAAWNVTYRRVGSGGGWPQTFDDGVAALAHLAKLDAPLDLGDVTALGFSAGFPLAVHAARHPGAVRPRRLVDIAGVAELARGARLGGPGCGTWALLGDPGEAVGTYAASDPIAQLPLGLPSLALHGDADALVPLAYSEAWVAAARAAGDAATLHVQPGAGHFDLHRPGTPGWAALIAWLKSEGASATA